jgi:hypothetical protein
MIPSNMVDAISAISDGELGNVKEIMIGELVVDALTGVDPYDKLDITEKPIDEGFTISDAAVEKPGELTLDIVLTNAEWSLDAGISAALTGNPGSLLNTWRDKRDLLYQMKANKEVVDVQTHDMLYESYMIRSISPWYDPSQNDEAFIATVSLQEIMLITDEGTSGEFDASLQSVGEL